MMATSADLTLELPNFEGPLDLLLHLIKSQKIDIYDIPIAKITSQNLAYLQAMKQLNLQLAGEFFLMSSTLLRIKSQYLLPQNDFDPEPEEDADPRDELVQQLVQYDAFKKAADFLKTRAEVVPPMLAKEASVSETKTIKPLPLGQLEANDLARTFQLVLHRLKLSQPQLAHLTMNERPITDMIDLVCKRVQSGNQVSFFACARTLASLSDVIGLFLALLELAKKNVIKVTQATAFGDLNFEGIDYND
ncbi:MAG: segregation/condensation protein A [Lactobacillus sp.]|nr:segregation/condensation protein A [Lactobacillus sp.]